MQLADVEDKDIVCPDLFLSAAKRLVEKIHTPPRNNVLFDDELSYFKLDFPILYATYTEIGEPLTRKTKDELMLLKAKLLEDVNNSNSVVIDSYEVKKFLGEDVLPSDPEACLEGLDLLEDQVLDQIRALKEKVIHLQRARCMVKKMLDGKRSIQTYDLTLFTSEANVKKPKHG